jgi:hypothetical protein
MSSLTTISIDKLHRLVGTPRCPAVVDVRTEEDFAADPRLIPVLRAAPTAPRRRGPASSRVAPPSSSANEGRS